MMTTSNEHNNAPAVPQGVPAQEVIDSIEAWKSAWLKVPPFADRVNKATREAITISHNSLFLLLQSAQQAQRMPAACPTPTGCGPHGCHGACIAATPAHAPAQEVTQSEPIYQLQCGDGSWIDQGKASYDYNAQYGINTIRIVYTAPAPAQEPETALQKFTRFKVAETEGNPVEMLRAFCAFAMNSQDWFDVEPFFDLVREAMASRTAVAPAQEVGLTEAERVRCLIASGCIGTVKMTYDSGPYEITRTSINGSRLIDAIIAAIRAKGDK